MREKLKQVLLWSQKYTKTDMLYLAQGGFWLTLGKTSVIASAFLLSIAFANLLPKEVYGTYQYVLSIIGLLTVTTLIELNTSLMRSVARGFEGEFFPALYTRMKFGVLGGLASLGLGGYYFFQGNNTLGVAFAMAAFFIPIMEPVGMFGDVLKGKKMFRLSAKMQMISRSLSFVAMGTTLFFTNNIFVVLLAYFIPRLLIRFFSHLYIIIKVQMNKKRNNETLIYGKQLSVLSVLQTFAAQLDKILVFHYLGAAELAVYYFAIAPEGQIKTLFSSLKTLAFPKFSNMDKELIKASLPRKILQFQLMIILPIVVIYIIAAPFVFEWLFPQYMDAVPFSQIAILMLLFFPKGLLSSALVAQKKTKMLYFLKTLSPVVRSLILLGAVYFYGLNGIVVGLVVNGAIIYTLYFAFFKKM